MTVATTAVDVTYVPDGATTVFAVPFAFIDADHVKVEIDGVETASGFSVSGAGDEDGGTLTFDTAPVVGTSLYVYRETPLTQEVAPVNNSTIFATVLGRGLDLGTLRDQELGARITRVVEDLAEAIEEAGADIGLVGKVAYTVLAASGGSALVGFLAAGSGTLARTLQAILRETVRLNDFTGADPTGVANSRAALVAAIAATPEGGTLELNGSYRFSPGITITKSMTIQGKDRRIGNVADGNLSESFLYCDSDAADAILVNGCVLTVDGVVLSGIGHTLSTGNGIRTTGANNSLILMGGTVIQSFKKGMVLSNGYYNRLLNASIVFCQTAIEADGVYNLAVSHCQIRPEGAGSRCLVLTNGAQASIEQTSLESFQENGIILLTGSGLRTRDCYFESDPNTTTAWNVFISDNCSYEEEGNHVYLTCARHISAEGSGTDNFRIVSKNNYFVPEVSTRRVDVYTFNFEKAASMAHIEGNIYVPGVAVGANNNWLSPDYTAAFTFAGGRGSYFVDFPPGHASAGRGYNTNPQVTDAAVAAFSSPRVLTMMGWKAADAASDPIGIRTAYGPNAPYRAVFQNGQWEKVGLRMANQADASGGATIDAEARTALNGLLAKLRAAGVMV